MFPAQRSKEVLKGKIDFGTVLASCTNKVLVSVYYLQMPCCWRGYVEHIAKSRS